MRSLVQDLVYACRVLSRQRGFTITVIITLALGIGANAAIFSVINGVMLKSLPYKDPGNIVTVFEEGVGLTKGAPLNASSTLNYRDWKDRSRSFQKMSARRLFAANLRSGDRSERLIGEQVSHDCFSLLGVQPLIGHDFSADDDRQGAQPVVLISRGLWLRDFGGQPEIVGKSIRLNGASATLIGVMPDDYRPLVQLWQPLIVDYATGDRMLHDIQVIARVAPGVTRAQAQTEIDGIQEGLAKEYPGIDTDWKISLVPMQDSITRNLRPALMILFTTVVLVLLIACANVANLLLARATSQQRESAIRVAIGASRLRLARQLLVECILLSLAGGVLGIVVAMAGTGALVGLNARGIPRAAEVGVDWRVVAFTAATCCLSAVIFGLLPALRASSPQVGDNLRTGGRTVSDRGVRRLRNTLVVGEVAVAVVLLAASGLAIRSFIRLQHMDPGFEPGGLLTFQVFLPQASYPDKNSRIQFQQEAARRLRQLPGVESTASVSVVPLVTPGPRYIFWADGHPLPVPSQAPVANYRVVSAGYFRTMRIPLLEGREFDETDTASSESVAIVNNEFAEEMWPGQDPIGKRMTVGVPLKADDVRWLKVIGVVEGVRQTALSAAPGMEMYEPFSQAPAQFFGFVIRSREKPGLLAEPARQIIASINPELPLSNVKQMDRVVYDSMAASRFNTYVLALFGLIAFLISAVGVFGVINYSVTQRIPEIGVRFALGATSRSMLKLILGEGLIICLIGLGIGLAGCLGATRLMSALLFDVGPTDWPTLLSVGLMFVAVGLFASLLPARRAARVDPLVALRFE